MKNFLKRFLFLSAFLFILILPSFIFTAPIVNSESVNPLDKLTEVAEEKGPFSEITETNNLAAIAGWAVAVFLSILGIIFIGLIIYAGYNWMTAGGEEDKINKAKDTIKNSIIGLVIVISAYVIWDFIFEKLILRL